MSGDIQAISDRAVEFRGGMSSGSAGSGDLENVFLGVPAAEGKTSDLTKKHRKSSG